MAGEYQDGAGGALGGDQVAILVEGLPPEVEVVRDDDVLEALLDGNHQAARGVHEVDFQRGGLDVQWIVDLAGRDGGSKGGGEASAGNGLLSCGTSGDDSEAGDARVHEQPRCSVECGAVHAAPLVRGTAQAQAGAGHKTTVEHVHVMIGTSR